MQKKRSLFFFTLLALLLAACSAGGMVESASPAMDIDTGGGFAESEEAFAPQVFDSKGDDSSAANRSDGSSVERLVIKNADLSVAVENPLEKMDQIMAMADEMGGFTVSSNIWNRTLENGVEVPQGNVTIRVPSNLFDEALTTIKSGVGQVVSEGVSGQDVTQEYIDLTSRVKNLQIAEEELQRIMEEARDTEDVLSVYNQLIYIREQIEVLQGRINYFEQSAAFSAISVSVLADEAVQPLSIGGWEPVGVAKNAIQALIDTAKLVANFLIWAVLYIVPILALLYIPFRLVRAGWRRLFKRKKKAAPTNPES